MFRAKFWVWISLIFYLLLCCILILSHWYQFYFVCFNLWLKILYWLRNLSYLIFHRVDSFFDGTLIALQHWQTLPCVNYRLFYLPLESGGFLATFLRTWTVVTLVCETHRRRFWSNLLSLNSQGLHSHDLNVVKSTLHRFSGSSRVTTPKSYFLGITWSKRCHLLVILTPDARTCRLLVPTSLDWFSFLLRSMWVKILVLNQS